MHKFFYFFLCLFFALCSCQSKKPSPKPTGVTAFEVSPQTLPADFEFVGVARSSHPVQIRSRVEGYLLSIDYTEGNKVGVGDLLFRIDPRQFEAQVEEAKGELARQEAVLWRAKRSLERIEPLYEKNAASKRDLDNAIAAVLTAEASVISAKANLTKAELNLSYTYIISPINGLTGKARFREGTLITPSINGYLTEVSVVDPIWVYFSISDNEVLQGQSEESQKTLILPKQKNYTVYLTLANGREFPYPGQVNFSSPTLDPETGALMVRATFPNPSQEILPGQFVRARVTGALRPDALFVPQQSVAQGRKGMYVFVIDPENRVSMRNVQVGARYKNYWVITQGLEKGEIVVVDGVNKIQNGSEVKVLSLIHSEPVIVPQEV